MLILMVTNCHRAPATTTDTDAWLARVLGGVEVGGIALSPTRIFVTDVTGQQVLAITR